MSSKHPEMDSPEELAQDIADLLRKEGVPFSNQAGASVAYLEPGKVYNLADDQWEKMLDHLNDELLSNGLHRPDPYFKIEVISDTRISMRFGHRVYCFTLRPGTTLYRTVGLTLAECEFQELHLTDIESVTMKSLCTLDYLDSQIEASNNRLN
jgi:hypothetical protein